MRPLPLVLLMLTWAAAGHGPAIAKSADCDVSPTSYAITNVNIVTMQSTDEVLHDRIVVIERDRILAIRPTTELRSICVSHVIDGGESYLLPGLHDMHAHLEQLEDPRLLGLFIGHGVTTIRSMDGRPFIREWRDQIARGERIGPTIVTAGPIIDGAPPIRDDNVSVASDEDARAQARAQIGAGYDFIKIYFGLSPDAYAGVIAEAERLGVRVAGHVPRDVTLAQASEDLWSLEHLSDIALRNRVSRDTPSPATDATPAWARRLLIDPLDPQRVTDIVAKLARDGVWVVPTMIERDRAVATTADLAAWSMVARDLVSSDALEFWTSSMTRASPPPPAENDALIRSARAQRLALLAELDRGGVNLVVGTDTPNAFVIPGRSVIDEISIFVEAGFTPWRAIAAATVDAARMSEATDRGVVQVGRRADLIMVTRNPLQDISALNDLSAVIVGGVCYGSTELQTMREALARNSADVLTDRMRLATPDCRLRSARTSENRQSARAARSQPHRPVR